MKNRKCFFAVDLGATSGRTIIGTLADGKVALEEITRFGNPLINVNGFFYWDLFALYNEIIKGLKTVAERGIEITSIGIDTWGCDSAQPTRLPRPTHHGHDGALLRRED